ncbi:RagB/SusD family nutrient uptake outer membrane protein [Rubrivirga litoralis]|uniref:RagB/SusD family nutrient uptake outer membrane protein n=1 Tax=Rubrivirga litoralis TaxID=3075598 RepID=A0ABU3BP72_9BACT|nr:RagB/SusD family nutrient uptake outer membrane protein [Rubrivirga sp. F394]MDT0631011.1 RagB/SusD family nutrient uptake outer membrane protein [Rubrivirga sp. F394]
MTFRSFPLARPATLVALLATAGLQGGCDSFLGPEPRGELTTDNFFETEAHAVQATNATYSYLRNWNVHVFGWIGMTDIASDQSVKGSTPADGSFLLDLDNLTFDPGNNAFSGTWAGYYRGIFRANVALEGIPRVPQMDEALRARLIGENQFLRAYYYSFLVRAYGGVPLVTEPLEPDELEQPRASREETYALIESDLRAAIEALPEESAYGAADAGRATKGAARSLLAKAHLYQEEYEEAYQQATAVINSGEYALYPDYAELFSYAGENSSESVFEVQTVSTAENNAGSQYSQVQGARGNLNLGWGFNQPSDQLEEDFEPGDPRREATILYPWEQIPDGSGRVPYLNPQIQNQRFNQKAFESPDRAGNQGNSGVNIRRIRYADVLLVAAEAAARTGRDAEAQRYLNEVRARARGEMTATLGLQVEALAPSIAQVLNLGGVDSRVFARRVEGAAAEAGLAPLDAGLDTEVEPAPIVVRSIDLVTSVDGAAVQSLADYEAAMASVTPGQTVSVGVVRLRQAAAGAAPTREDLTLSVTAEALLPDVTAAGDALVQAIWRERGSELAMEQHRWFDIIRQGRAPELMAAAGKTFIVGKHELYPIPQSEVESFGLQQNPGY